jgi:putative spermidine/putrescine transport system ATP-binding protein
VAARADGGLALQGGASLRCAHGADASAAFALVRPERVRLGAQAERCENRWDARVARAAFLGPDALLELELEGGGALRARIRHEAGALPATGTPVRAGVAAADVWPLPAGREDGVAR